MRKLSCTLMGGDTPVDYLENFISRVPYLQFQRDQEDENISNALVIPPTDLLFCEPGNINKLSKILPLNENPVLVVCLVNGRDEEYRDLDDNIFSIEQLPLTFERFLSVVDRARLYIQHHKALQSRKNSEFVFVKSEYKMIRVKFSEILFCEGLKDYTQIYLEGKNQPILTLQNLKSFSAKLPSDNFIRIHRSFVVALNHIDMVGRNEVVVGKRNIPIGNSFREEFYAVIEHYS